MKKKQLFILCVIVIISVIIVINLVVPLVKYNKATALLNTSNYISSIKIFESIENYKDSKQLIEKAKNLQADELIQMGEYYEAYKILESMGNEDFVNKNIYERAIKLFEENNYAARILFGYIEEYADSSEKIKEIEFNMIRDKLTDAAIGDTIEFGTYEQDNNSENGEENIEWIVLDNKDGKLFVLSKYCLKPDYYDDTYAFDFMGDIVKEYFFYPPAFDYHSTWKNCSLSEHLNNTFFETAFNEVEKELITPTLYHTKKDSEESFETYNNIVLLSITEARIYFKTTNSLKAKPTAKAIERGLHEKDGYSAWWLRDDGTLEAPCVDEYGIISNELVNSENGVRPAMWLKIPN